MMSKSRMAYGEAAVSRMLEWYEVSPGEEQPFDFTTRKKNRHRVSPGLRHEFIGGGGFSC